MRNAALSLLLAGLAVRVGSQPSPAPQGDAALAALFADWREARRPRVVAGVPDYTQDGVGILAARLVEMRKRLATLDPAGLSPAGRIDRRLVEAEMNGLDFDLRVLRPWQRDPAFYVSAIAAQSDTPTREGPTIEGATPLWRLKLPLDAQGDETLRRQLAAIPGLLEQARANLTADTRDLWRVGARAHREQVATLAGLAERLRPYHPALLGEVERARAAADAFRAWLEAGLASKRGPSGVGREAYDWYLKNVHLRPYTWQGELELMQAELARAQTMLSLEEHRNRALPPLEPVASEAEWRERSSAALAYYVGFLREQQVMSVRDYYEPALRERIGGFVPPEKRDFFTQVDAREPLLLRCHGSHWLDLARMEREPHPSPVRRGPLLYNIWDGRSEGFATAMEELMLGAGLYADRPRSRELVYVMIAQRAARAIAGLRMHSNEWTLDEAVSFACSRTPRGWLRPDGDTVWGEQQLYLEQPGYGSSYLAGKAELEALIAEEVRRLGEHFTLSGFMDRLFASGMIPMALVREEMAGS